MPSYPIPKVPMFKYTRRCTHTHMSGRRCEVRVAKRDQYGSAVLFCPLHSGECSDCKGMMAAFVPPKGWT